MKLAILCADGRMSTELVGQAGPAAQQVAAVVRTTDTGVPRAAGMRVM